MNTRLILAFALLFAAVIALYCSILASKKARERIIKQEQLQLENN